MADPDPLAMHVSVTRGTRATFQIKLLNIWNCFLPSSECPKEDQDLEFTSLNKLQRNALDPDAF